jgi:hypothetical protein
MAFTELELKRCERDLDAFLLRRRPPPSARAELDLGYQITGHSIELMEIRAAWNNPSQRVEHPFAKITYVRTANTWKLYWKRASGKWQAHDPHEFRLFEMALQSVDRDECHCFFG